MAGGNRRPQEGEKTESWLHENLKDGKPVRGWKAGPMQCFEVHTGPPSKPCVKILTGGRFRCVCESKAVRTSWLGYLPIYREDNRRVFVTVHQYTFESIDLIPFRAAVMCTRGSEYRAGVWARAATWAKKYESTSPDRQEPAHLTPWLFNTLFKMAEYLPYAADDEPEKPAPVVVEEAATDPATDSEGVRYLSRLRIKDKGPDPVLWRDTDTGGFVKDPTKPPAHRNGKPKT